MESHKYILKEDDVGQLATSVALQEGDVKFTKDNESSFYIATVIGEGISVPDSIAALEMALSEKPEAKKNELIKVPKETVHEHEEEISDESTDLTVRLHFSQAIKPEKLPLIYEEIAKAIDSAIRKMDEPEK